ncbi:hypothetical protein ATK36_3060 [Amycolatopsis sulphurea]|uniref:Uncharacterized protein n=1 Tax=Amycolatopsis sulphurea TaxID=76022 RepID=A0A2A9FBR6_9PSEU|nr:hypothetical protein [Amycolatopsis sulphurea]PFG47992.1 hypothetical protein ATK36_3060 [Amycolatopsis sulphurea]
MALLLCFATAVVLGVRRSTATVPLLAATAALLCCDAWFDAVLDWHGPGLAMAVCAELPIAAFLSLRARTLLSGDLQRRPLTMRDTPCTRIQSTNGSYASHRAPSRRSAALADPAVDVPAALYALTEAGYLRRARDGRWHSVAHETAPAEFDEQDRATVSSYLDAKYDRELRMFSWAAKHREAFGPWAAALTAEDRFRQGVRRAGAPLRPSASAAGPRPREVALRFSVFPSPEPADLREA